jgi:hypothetical protein
LHDLGHVHSDLALRTSATLSPPAAFVAAITAVDDDVAYVVFVYSCAALSPASFLHLSSHFSLSLSHSLFFFFFSITLIQILIRFDCVIVPRISSIVTQSVGGSVAISCGRPDNRCHA